MLGPEPQDQKDITILGRKVIWRSWGISYEADPKHRRLILECFGLGEGSRKLTVNGAKEEPKDKEEEEGPELTKEEKTSFRAVAARLNFLAADCPDSQLPAKEVCRDMAEPTAEAFRKLKKVARYLLFRKAVSFRFVWQREGEQLRVFTDSDWAGCLKTRKSTSGGVVKLGTHCIKTWCLSQAAIALSSAEAEYYSMVEGATRGIGIKTMLGELGVPVDIVLATDSSAAKSLGSRRGTGKIRHIETKWLWLQAEVAQGRIRLEKVPGDINPADVLTKYKNAKGIEELLGRMGVDVVRLSSGDA